MHYLIFGPADKSGDPSLGEIDSFKELYEMLYDSATNTPHGFSKPETRVFGRVLTKLESVGVASERNTRVKSFDLLPDGGTVALENSEFEILITALNEVAWQARYTRKADSLYTFLENSPNEPPKPKLVNYEAPKESSGG